ncbi:MAG: MotA/TolQ/ExbB proton channel family protein [Planctomycetia bacterium]
MSKLNALATFLIRSPLLWGGAASFCFFALIHGGIITDANVVRYLAGHWVEYVEVVMFAVGLAALGIMAADVARQRRHVGRQWLEPIPEGGQNPADATGLAEALAEAADEAGEPARGYLVRRLREAIDLVVRTGSADSLEEHLKYLSDLDASRAAQGYGLVRFVIWAIPIMGFLGTVIGITVAIACLSPTQLENISGVVAGLGTAFDTTATALRLSMVLLFLQFVIDRSEQKLLGEVDAAAWAALAGRFQSLSGDGGAALAVARLGETVSRGTARLLEAQEQSWRALERTATTHLGAALDQAGNRLNASLAGSLDQALVRFGESLMAAHESVLARREDRWAEATETLSQAVRGLERHQTGLADQTALLGKVVEATRDITALERSLDANLQTLTTSQRFDETLATLAAAVQLLAVRAGDVSGDTRRVELPARRTGPGKAA